MGKEYRDFANDYSLPTTTPEMRAFCQRPGLVGDDGRPQYRTEQVHKDICDVNNIIRQYDKRGLITHVSKIEAKYGDLSGLDFKHMQDTICNAKKMFEELPSKIRNRFKNDPKELIEFMDDPENREEAIQLGIINAGWSPETDGLGEHVKEGENILKREQEALEEEA